MKVHILDIASRVQILREEMQKNEIDVYIVPSVDAHNSEYVPECWERRSFISGFDGSAGEAMITLDHAYLSTDGRYFNQATKQLDGNTYSLIKQSGFVSETEQWLINNAKNKTIGVDPRLISISRANRLIELTDGIAGTLVFTEDNLVDECKKKCGERLDLPNEPAFNLDIQYAGESTVNRIEFVRRELNKHNADFIALNVLDEIAWVFNIRGNDILYNPLVISYAIIGLDNVWLFVDSGKISSDLRTILSSSGVSLLDYQQFGTHLASLNGVICLDDKTANYWMLDKVSASAEVLFIRSPIVMAKACKNTVETKGAAYAHVKDAVAVISFLCWLDNNWSSGITELSCIDRLAEYRKKQENLKGMSFATISGFASNGAVIHYRADSTTNKVVDDSSLYLIDSGGQYLEGTTDITRTVHLGQPTPAQKRHYTLVLKGHLALGRAIFPHGTCGEHLDILARNALWSEYLNYRHGTGHGVGSFLCVHEGPQKISSAPSNTMLLPGMIVSNEPGVYIDGEYGIRIENLCLVTKDASDQATSSEYGPFYKFEDLTLVPYAKKLIDISLLSREDKEQIKVYYAKIVSQVKNRLGQKEQEWLMDQLDLFG